MIPFDFRMSTRIVYGPGTLSRIGELATKLGARRALVVSDAGVVQAGHTQHGMDYLRAAGVGVELFSDVHANPTSDDVDAGVTCARSCSPDLIIGLGGGSSMDCAKGINFVISNGGRIHDYWGIGKATKPMLPMIAVPTTAGTGSEAQSFALISDAETHVKMACGDKKATFRVAILDPDLTRTQPALVTALTGIDAVAHAVESYVTKRRNDVSQTFSREAWHLLSGSFPVVLDDPDNLTARGAMQWGACLSGMAIENSMLGAAHSLANPLTAHYDIVHGQAVATMLPHVIRFNAQVCDQQYSELARHTMPAAARGETTEQLAQTIQRFIRQAGLDTSLRDQGVPPDDLPRLAEEAARQWTADFNPREVTPNDMLQLYQVALDNES